MQLFNIQSGWQAWILFVLVFQLLLTGLLQPAAVTACFRNLVSPIQRQYLEQGNDSLVSILQRLFQLGTLAFCLIVVVESWQGRDTNITLLHYGLVIGLIVGVALIKHVFDRAVHYAFDVPVTAQTFFRHRCMLWVVVCLMLFVHLLLTPYMSVSLQWIVPAAIYGIYLIFLIAKLLKLFGLSVKHILYLIIYTTHLEILPMIVLLMGTDYISRVLND